MMCFSAEKLDKLIGIIQYRAVCNKHEIHAVADVDSGNIYFVVASKRSSRRFSTIEELDAYYDGYADNTLEHLPEESE